MQVSHKTTEFEKVTHFKQEPHTSSDWYKKVIIIAKAYGMKRERGRAKI